MYVNGEIFIKPHSNAEEEKKSDTHMHWIYFQWRFFAFEAQIEFMFSRRMQ